VITNMLQPTSSANLAAKRMVQALTALSAGWRFERQRSTGSSQAK
jgi:hypothetical protein